MTQKSLAMRLLFVAFLGLGVTAFIMSDTAGSDVCKSADSVITASGGMFATFAIMMLVALTWLSAAYGRGGNGIISYLRWAVYVGSAFSITLMAVSSQSYMTQVAGMDFAGDLSVYLVAAGATLISASAVGWKLRRRWRVLRMPAATGVEYRDAKWCAAAALIYLAVVGIGSGIVLAFPKNWYQPDMNLTLAYLVGWTALLLPFPVLTLASRAIAAKPPADKPSKNEALLHAS